MAIFVGLLRCQWARWRVAHPGLWGEALTIGQVVVGVAGSGVAAWVIGTLQANAVAESAHQVPYDWDCVT
ncbi:MAG: hypothetical protein M0Z69_11955 [Actinomycetota bacterium]|nr:hypothetical protein [Actinomycetota bacterium]